MSIYILVIAIYGHFGGGVTTITRFGDYDSCVKAGTKITNDLKGAEYSCVEVSALNLR